MRKSIALSFVVGIVVPAALGENYLLLTGADLGLAPGMPRSVAPVPGPGFPGTFVDGDRLAGGVDAGVPVEYVGNGTPLFDPNEFGALSFLFRRGTIPVGGPNLVPLMGIEYLGGPRLDLDGDPLDAERSLVPVSGAEPAIVPGIPSFIQLTPAFDVGQIFLENLDAISTNEGAPGTGPDIATTVITLAGTSSDGQTGEAINAVDDRTGDLTAFSGRSGTLAGVWRIENLGYEIWEDSIDPNSGTASTLGTFQFLGELRGWLIERDPETLEFPALAGEGLGSTLWPAVDTSAIGQSFNTSLGDTATIVSGLGGDGFTAPNNGGVAMQVFDGDLGAYLESVVYTLAAGSRRIVYLEAAGWGINNSFDPIFGDTVGYDVVLVAASERCPGDLDADFDVDLADLGALLSAYGQNAGGDLDGDGDTDLSDLGGLLAAYGLPCP